MRITKELLTKYMRGTCSEAEKEAIENWLPSEGDITENLSKEVSKREEDNVWANIIAHRAASHKKVIPLNQGTGKSSKYFRYVAAACFTLAIFTGGFLTSNKLNTSSEDKLVEVSYPIPEPALYISTLDGTPEKVRLEDYHIKFKGAIRLYNQSTLEKTVTCNGKELVLQPNKLCFVMSSPTMGAYVFPRDLAYDDGFREEYSQSNFFEVCVKS